MIPLSIGSATQVYGNASRCEITRHWVDHTVLADVSRIIRSLVQSLGGEAEEDFWRQTIGPIRKLAFAFCSSPLPFAEAVEATGTDWSKIRRQTRLCQQMFPDSHSTLADLVQKLEQLGQESGSPLITPLEELAQHGISISVVLRNPRMNQAAARYFAGNRNLRNAKVVSASQLRGAHISDALVAIGPCAWFPEFVFSAPRAPTIHVISYRWIRDTWKPGPVLLHSSAVVSNHGNHRMGVVPIVGGDAVRHSDVVSDVLPVEIVPPLPSFTRNPFANAGAYIGNDEETIPARLCHLSGNRAVFVTSEEGACSLVIDTSELGHSAVGRVPTEELEPGQYLLLRTSGGGDFIAPLADRILGEFALERRSQQAEWKDRLMSKALEQFGSLSRRELSSCVAAELRSRQLSQVRAANVHYWMSAKCISPRKIDDFIAILTFAGLESRAQKLCSAMDDIDSAHRQAGHKIRQMLLQKIDAASQESLERDGEMVFDLGDMDGGAISAFQIIGISTEEFNVPTDQIGVLLDTEDC